MRKNVIFDLDGTLTQSEEGIWKCVQYAAEKMGRPQPDAETLRRFVGPPLAFSFRTYMGMTEQEAVRAVEIYRERYVRVGKFENRVYPGIRTLLRTLNRNGITCCVATGKPESTSREIICHFGLDRYFRKIVGPDGATMNADKKDLVLRAKDPEADEVWMVGDRKFDVLGGRDAGVHTIGVGYGYGDEQELRDAGCDVYCATVEDLLRTLCPDGERARGVFVSMEGLDGSGKSTQMDRLEDLLDRFGYEVVRTREPGGCPISEKIRTIILDRENAEMTPETEAILYAASRAQHVRQVIRPAVEAGRCVLSDRFLDSSVAYQGGGRELGVDEVMEINRYAVGNVMPDLTVFLDMPHEAALKRRYGASVPDRLEMEGEAFHARVEAAYREMIRRTPDRFVCVDASAGKDEVAQSVRDGVIPRLMQLEADNE